MKPSLQKLAEVAKGSTEAEARKRRREQAIANLEVVGRQEGASPQLVAEAQRDLRNAFVVADTLDQVFGAFGLKP